MENITKVNKIMKEAYHWPFILKRKKMSLKKYTLNLTYGIYGLVFVIDLNKSRIKEIKKKYIDFFLFLFFR